MGPSARAKLLRAFVSTTIGVVVAIDLLHVYAHWIFFEDNAFMSGVSTMAFAVITAALIARVALKVGDDMDRSEEVRKQTEWVLTESEENRDRVVSQARHDTGPDSTFACEEIPVRGQGRSYTRCHANW